MGLTEERRKEIEQQVAVVREYYWASENAPTPHERRLVDSLIDLLAALAEAERRLKFWRERERNSPVYGGHHLTPSQVQQVREALETVRVAIIEYGDKGMYELPAPDGYNAFQKVEAALSLLGGGNER